MSEDGPIVRWMLRRALFAVALAVLGAVLVFWVGPCALARVMP